MKPVVIYHDHCMDGMGAAWAAWKHFNGDVELIAADYGQQPPHLIDRQVFIVDFSYSLPVLQHMGATNNVMVIDHHKTAAKDLAMLHSAGTIADFDAFCDQGGGVIRVLFDMERSGAGLTWDFFNPGMPRPYLIDRIEDRDLWKFHYESSRPLHSYLSSFVFSMEMFDDTMVRFEDTGHRLFRKAEGVAIDRMHMKRCRELVKESLQRVDVRHGEYLVINQVPIVNAPFNMNFMFPVPDASIPAVDICSERSVAGMIFSAKDTR